MHRNASSLARGGRRTQTYPVCSETVRMCRQFLGQADPFALSGLKFSNVAVGQCKFRMNAYSCFTVQCATCASGLTPLAAPLKPNGRGLYTPTKLTSLSGEILSSMPTVQ